MLDRVWDWVHKQDFMLWFRYPWNCHGTNLFFVTNQSCFQTKRICYESQNTWKTGYLNWALYTHEREKWQRNSCYHHGSSRSRDLDLCCIDHPELRQAKLQPATELLQATRELEQLASGRCEKHVGWASWYSRICVRHLLCTETLAKYSTIFRGYIYTHY